MLNRIIREPMSPTTAHPCGPKSSRGELPRHKRLALGILLVGVLTTMAIQGTLVRQVVTHIEAEKPVVSRPCGEMK